MNWTGHYNKLINEYIGNSGWTWTTDRWAHKQAKVNNVYQSLPNVPMQIQWMRGSTGTWDNIATLTTKLDKGTYFYGVEGQGGMMTLNKNRWMRHSGYECAETQIFLGVDGAATAADTLNCGMLPTNAYKSYINKYTIAEDQTSVNVGIRCNQSMDVKNGFDVFFSNPVLYKVLVKGELTPEQKAYLATVETQIAALEGRIQVAEELVAATQTEKPWGKENLQKGIDAVKARLDAWKKYDQDALLELMDEGEAKYEATAALFYVENEYVAKDSVYTYETLGNVIMNAGVRYLNNEFINVFNNVNVPLTDMPAAIEAAKSVLGERIFTSSSKKGALTAKIADVEALYKAKLAAPYSAENAEALVNAKAELAQMVEDFKAAIASDVLVDINFDGASFVKHEDPNGEEDTYYTLAGKKGEMKFKEVAEALGTTLYELGYRASEEAEVDSVGMLRVGSGSANVAFAAIPESTDNIVRVSFDLYFGNLITKSAGYYLTAENGDTICGLVCSKYSNTSLINTHEVDFNGKINAVGSSAASNAAIAAKADYKYNINDDGLYLKPAVGFAMQGDAKEVAGALLFGWGAEGQEPNFAGFAGVAEYKAALKALGLTDDDLAAMGFDKAFGTIANKCADGVSVYAYSTLEDKAGWDLVVSAYDSKLLAGFLPGLKVAAQFQTNTEIMDDFFVLDSAIAYSNTFDIWKVSANLGTKTAKMGDETKTGFLYGAGVETDGIIDNTTLYAKYEGGQTAEDLGLADLKGSVKVGAKIHF